MQKVFLTGATGYIGGQVLRELCNSKTEFKICALVRDDAKAAKVRAAYPNVRTVIGDLDNGALLKQEASEVSVVLHLAATGHLDSVKAIHAGLSSRPAGQAAYWIQVSGASVLAAAELASPSFVPGSASSAIFDDLQGIDQIRSVIRRHPSRVVDNYVLDGASAWPNIRTALVFPPIIYGVGEGPINQQSIQLPLLVNATINLGHGVQLGYGQNSWGNVHIRDVGKVFSLLAEAAAGNIDDNRLWNDNGLYLTNVAEETFGNISSKVASVANQKGLIHKDDVKQLTAEEFEIIIPHGKVLFGTNARGKAMRAKTLLCWKSTEHVLDEDITRLVLEHHRST